MLNEYEEHAIKLIDKLKDKHRDAISVVIGASGLTFIKETLKGNKPSFIASTTDTLPPNITGIKCNHVGQCFEYSAFPPTSSSYGRCGHKKCVNTSWRRDMDFRHNPESVHIVVSGEDLVENNSLHTDPKIIAINLLKSHHPERNKFTEHDLDFIKKVIIDTIPQGKDAPPTISAIRDGVKVVLHKDWPKGDFVKAGGVPHLSYLNDEWFGKAVDVMTSHIANLVGVTPKVQTVQEWVDENSIKAGAAAFEIIPEQYADINCTSPDPLKFDKNNTLAAIQLVNWCLNTWTGISLEAVGKLNFIKDTLFNLSSQPNPTMTVLKDEQAARDFIEEKMTLIPPVKYVKKPKLNDVPFSTPLPAPFDRVEDIEGLYLDLNQVLNRAYNQAAAGKGKERHAQGKPFNEQPMQVISDLIGSQDGLYYQAIKKIQESSRLPTKERQVAELLGAIVYIAGAIINLEGESGCDHAPVINAKMAADGSVLCRRCGLNIKWDDKTEKFEVQS